MYLTIYILYLYINSEQDLIEYQAKCEYLKQSLLLNVKAKETFLVQPPDISQIRGGYKSLTVGAKLTFFFGKVLIYIMNIIGFSHIIPSMLVLCCFCCFTWPFKTARNCMKATLSEDKWINLFMSTNFFTVPALVVYFAFLDSGAYDEIQSWHIFYITWGASIGIMCVITSFLNKKQQSKFDNFLWSVIGVEATDTGKGYDDPSWFIVACLPAVVAGFIANYILEEKFLLECDNDTGDICFEDGRGCCVVISSHKLENFYDFMGGLFSNILAAYAFIRICGWILALGDLEMRAYATKRN